MIEPAPTALEELRVSAIRLRHMADQAEALLQLDAFMGMPGRYQKFVSAAASLARAAAAALEEAIDVHRSTHALLDQPQPQSRPRPKLVE